MFFAPTFHHRHHAIHATGLARNVIVGGAGIFERKPHKFTPSLNLRPVKKLVTHGITLNEKLAGRSLARARQPVQGDVFQPFWTRRTDFPAPITRFRPAAFAS